MDRQTPLVQLLKSTSTIIPSSNNANLDTFMFETPLLAELTKKITELYKDDLVFALLFGSRVDGEFKQNSDYDILIVEKSPYKDQSRHEQIKRIFIELQEKEELKVDYDYPGEYIDIFTLNKAILGYGFVYDDKEVIIEKVGAKDWNRFNEYRQWLSAMSGPNILLAGNIKDFVEYKERAIKTLIKLVICKRDFTFKDSSELVDLLVLGGKEYLGMKNIPSVRKYLEDLIELVLHELIQENIIIKGDNKFHVNFEICVKSIELLISTDENEFRKSFFGGITDFDKQVITDVVSDNLSYVSSLNKTIDYRSDKDLQEDISEDLPMDATGHYNVQKQYASIRLEIQNINQTVRDIAFS